MVLNSTVDAIEERRGYMVFIEKEWWKDTNWFKIFLAGCLVVLLFIAGGVTLFPRMDLSSVQSNFGVEIPTDGAARLYDYNTQGWMGDGEDYSVWQYRNPDKLMAKFNWQKGKAFQHENFEWMMNPERSEHPEGYFLPRELEQEVYYFVVNHDIHGYDDDCLLLVFAPEVKLGDGKYYENLLFVAAWYS